MAATCYSCFHQKAGDGPCPDCGYDPEQDREKYAHALPPGTVLAGMYVIGRVLGQGGFGITYAAQEYKSGNLVAVKEFYPDTMVRRGVNNSVIPYTGERGEDFVYGRSTFLEEARTLAATFYYAVTGQVPPDSIDRVDSDALLLPSKLGVEVSAQQEKALSSGLSVLPENRFQSVRDLRSALYDGRKTVLFRKGKKKPRSIFRTILLAANVVVVGFFDIIFILAALRSIVYTVTDEPYGEGVYSGEWRNNAPSGQGTMVFTNGDRYEGEWEYGNISGTGTMDYADGSSYEGEWDWGGREGEGTMIYANGDRYEGEWSIDDCHGAGTMTYANGDRYEGEWSDKQKNSIGILSCADGDQYDSSWNADQFLYRTVKITYENGDQYEGGWLDGARNDTGTMTYANGVKLTASKWRGNTVFTDGTEFVTLPDGSQHEPIWIDGKLALDGY